jgi:hypothetical protein
MSNICILYNIHNVPAIISIQLNLLLFIMIMSYSYNKTHQCHTLINSFNLNILD